MSRLPENVQGVLGVLVGLIGGVILILFIRVGLFQETFRWETVGVVLLGGGVGGLVGITARASPRIRIMYWVVLWAFLVAGFTWIITALVSEQLFDPMLRVETLIPPIIAALLTCGGFAWWYRLHPPPPSNSGAQPK
jgi:hypothetical protein